jgi:monoamine oxidase
MQTPPATDCAADALAPGCEWNNYIRAMCGFISGAGLERISATDFAAYDAAATAFTGEYLPGTASSSPPACRRP